MLTESQRERFARQLLLPEVGEAGQLRLLAARVTVRAPGVAGNALCRELEAAGVTVAPAALPAHRAEGASVAVQAALSTLVGSAHDQGEASWLLGDAGVARIGTALCRDCAADWLRSSPPPAWAAEVVAQAVGSLAASQILLELLGRGPAQPAAWSVWPRFGRAAPHGRIGCRCA